MSDSAASASTIDVVSLAGRTLARLRDRRPRVQCLTNTVAQEITANVLLAAGVRVSMSTHADEVVAMSATADALLFNLGTPDEARFQAIRRLLREPAMAAKPRVLDPVFVEHSPVRLALAREILAAGAPVVPPVVKANAAEIGALDVADGIVRIETGAVDRIGRAAHGGSILIANGHPWMAAVTGLGCALGALVAACLAVEADAQSAAAAAVLAFGVAGDMAAERAHGPGTLGPHLLDAIAALDAATIAGRARVSLC